MNKINLILKYFQKADQLTTKNQHYCSTLSSLFLWLIENDKANSDVTSKMLNLQEQAKAVIISKQEGVVAGLEELAFLLQKNASPSFEPLTTDGKTIKSGQTIAKLTGNTLGILSVERTILNILQRMSGIATEASKLIDKLKTGDASEKIERFCGKASFSSTPTVSEPRPRSGRGEFGRCTEKSSRPQQNQFKRQDPPYIAATRKTPWMQLDKKAIAVGGGLTHRLNLSDGILIKDNHLIALKKQYGLKTIEQAIIKSLEKATKTPLEKHLVEIEVGTPDQAFAAIETFHKHNTNNHLALMFDNFSPDQASAILSNLSDLDRHQIIFEASGGITADNIHQWAKTGVDILSLGALTHSPKAVNFSLEIV